jgi:hypothetical protein
MTAVAREGADFVISVHARDDQPGFVVQVTRDERTAQVPADTRRDADHLADCIRELLTHGIGESIFTD